MAYETPQGPSSPVYHAQFMDPEYEGYGPVRFNVQHEPQENTELDADRAFQKLVNLITNTPDFEMVDATKQTTYRSQLTPNES